MFYYLVVERSFYGFRQILDDPKVCDIKMLYFFPSIIRQVTILQMVGI